MPRPYVRLRETTFDLYVERDLLPAYYQFIATISSWLILAGYILFAINFTTAQDGLQTLRNSVTAAAITLLVLGYMGILVAALLSRSLLFLIDGVILPALTASIIGLFTTIATFALYSMLGKPEVYMSILLVVACITTVVSAVTLLFAYRELNKIRKRDERRRWHVNLGPYVGNNNEPATLFNIHNQDDDAQRRQLLRLLQDRHEGMINHEDVVNTFKIDLPGEHRPDGQREIGQMRDPPSRGGFGLGNFLPWKGGKMGTFKDARERRREEIERSSIPNLSEQWRAQDPDCNQSTQPPAWGWPPATRYA